MSDEKNALEIPYGMRDFLPGEAEEARAISSTLANLFRSWGYDEVSTPAVEFLDTLTIGGGTRAANHIFKLSGGEDRTLALRHEMTTPIARLAASRMSREAMPLKFSYIASVWRRESAQAGRQCEFHQAGVEFMGASSAAADAEIIAIAVTGMRRAGLKNFIVSIGQSAFVSGLMNEFALPDDLKKAVLSAAERHDLVALSELAKKTGRETLAMLPMLHGGAEIIENAKKLASNDTSLAALENLGEILRLLGIYGADGCVQIDLGIMRDSNYYTGMVFEAYTPGLGFPIAGGGRYDNMLKEFGEDRPATGFAIGIERVMLALLREGLKRPREAKDVLIAYAEGKVDDAIRIATDRRRREMTAELSPLPMTREDAERLKREKDFHELVYVE